jgi:hypothetical protein
MIGLARNLRIGVAIFWVVLWNLLLGAAIWLNGGFNPPFRLLASRILEASAFLGTSLFATLILMVPSVATWALRPGSQVSNARSGLYVVALITAALGLFTLFGANV